MKADTGVWMNIPGFPGYHANAGGQIRSCRIWNKPRILKPAKNKNGYLMVMLGRGNSCYVHELVLLAFHGQRPMYHQASHVNGVRDDNRIGNLRWESPKDNNARKVAHGTNNHGERQGAARLTAEDVYFIRTYPKTRGLFASLARKYNVSPQTIEDAYKQRTWRHLAWPTNKTPA